MTAERYGQIRNLALIAISVETDDPWNSHRILPFILFIPFICLPKTCCPGPERPLGGPLAPDHHAAGRSRPVKGFFWKEMKGMNRMKGIIG